MAETIGERIAAELTLQDETLRVMILIEAERNELRKQLAAKEAEAGAMREALGQIAHGQVPDRDADSLRASIQEMRIRAIKALASNAGEALLARLRAAEAVIDQIGQLSTGWKHGNEGVYLLRINALASGHGAPLAATKEGS